MKTQKNKMIFFIWSAFYLLLCITLIVWQSINSAPSPQLFGVDDICCILGEEKPNFSEKVKAKDSNEKDITNRITIDTSNVDWNTAGVYKVIYSVKGRFSKKISKTIRLTIVPAYPYFEGQKDLFILKGDIIDFVEGVNAYDGFGKSITENIEVSISETYSEHTGTYTVKYSVKDDYGFESNTEINLHVLNDYLPVFYGLKNIEYTIGSGQTDLLQNVNAYDYKGKEITEHIVIDYETLDLNKIGEYTITYTVADKENNTKIEFITIKVVDIDSNLYPKIYGIKNYNLELGDALPDWTEGVSAFDFTDNDLTSMIIIDDSEVINNKVGEYYVYYSVQNSLGLSYNGVSIVRVNEPIIDITSPIFTGIRDIEYYIGDSYPDFLAGVKAIDDFDGDITNNIIVDIQNVDFETPGIYTIRYTILDSSNNQSIEIVNIHVIDDEPPKFFNIEDNIVYMIGDPIPNYIDGVTARDNVDGILTEYIQVFENVDYEKEGEYLITYKISDNSGNINEVTITVVVMGSIDYF